MWQMERPYLAICVFQPLEPQVDNNSRGAIINWEDVYLEMLRCHCHNLWRKPKEKSHHTKLEPLKSVGTSEWAAMPVSIAYHPWHEAQRMLIDQVGTI